MWHRHHAKHNEFSSENQRTFYAVRSELSAYHARALDGGIKGWHADTVFTVEALVCAVCGGRMLARQGVMTCSYRCGRIHRNGVYEQRRASKERPTEMPREEHRADDDHPEVIALRAIERALRALPDQTARERVLDYARGWCVSVERAKPNGAIVAVEQQDLHADG